MPACSLAGDLTRLPRPVTILGCVLRQPLPESENPMASWLRYLFAFIVFAHGFVYVRIGAVLPGPVKEWNGQSWLLGRAVTGDGLIALSRTVHVAAGVAILACSVALALAHASWRPLAIAGAVAGLVAFAVFWDGQTRYLFEEGAIGAAVSLALLVGALLL